MVQEGKLAEVLADFARTLLTEFSIQSILDHLVQRIVEVLPITAAGVTLVSARTGPRYLAASDELALRLERLQEELGEGPCVQAFASGEAVAIPDLRADADFPRFAPAAVSAGLAAVFTLPLHQGDARIGALDLYRDTPGPMGAHDMDVAQTLADVAAAYLLNDQSRESARAARAQLEHRALHDPLTGLPNRALLLQRLEHAARRAQRSHAHAAVLFVDLDRFKQVNDRYGHHVGDELLVAVASRLATVLRSGDTLARFSGDEFVILCEDLHSTADAELLAGRIDEAFAEPFPLSRMSVAITASVGLTFAGPAAHVSEEVLVNADMAMYQAKRRGGAGHHVFDLREALATRERNSLEVDLRSALADDELEVAYQPIVRCADGRITGVEALLRWTHPERGPVPPSAIVPVAEDSALINEVDAWVMERSCRDRQRWLDDHPDRPLELALNVSARHLMSRDFTATLESVLARTHTDPAAVVLEVTENIFVENTDRVMTVLLDLKQRGVRLAVDDLGTGYSSLSYLRRLPIDIVKIDRSFITEIDRGHKSAAIVAGITNMAHALDLIVTAEGVETEGQSRQVQGLGCDLAQGYFYGRPVPTDAIDARLDVLTGQAPTDLSVCDDPLNVT